MSNSLGQGQCYGYDEVVVSIVSNDPPSVSIVSPTNGQTVTAPASIPITASASDVDGSITKVEFYQGATLLGADVTAPYSYTWNGVVAGTYALTAKAFDNLGATTTSGTVTVTVTPRTTDVIPVADAYVSGAATSQNYGSADTLFAWTNSTTANKRDTYLKFDLNGTGSAVTSAILRVYMNYNTAGSIQIIGAYRCSNTTWTENGIPGRTDRAWEHGKLYVLLPETAWPGWSLT